MRKIEEAMLKAIDSEKSWHDGNTSVIVRPDSDGENEIIITLHGNEIARSVKRKWSVTLAGWNTPTTRSRHKALRSVTGMSFSQKDWLSYLNGVFVDPYRWYTVEDGKVLEWESSHG